jgi:hypothetical protein
MSHNGTLCVYTHNGKYIFHGENKIEKKTNSKVIASNSEYLCSMLWMLQKMCALFNAEEEDEFLKCKYYAMMYIGFDNEPMRG